MEFIFSECFTDFQLEKQLSLELSWKRAGNELERSQKRVVSSFEAECHRDPTWLAPGSNRGRPQYI